MSTALLALVDRIAARSVAQPDGCWEWTGPLTLGYGRITERVDGRNLNRRVHRVAFEALVAEVPDGLELDHLCRNRACWNPDHLEPVTHRVNMHRGKSPTVIASRAGLCLRGHPMEPGSYYTTPDGRKNCRECRRDLYRRHRANAKVGGSDE